jgi:soluble lytic murein transglycosylase-like protein
MLRISTLFALSLLLLVSTRLVHADSLYLDTSNATEITISSDAISGAHILEFKSQNESVGNDVNFTRNTSNRQEMHTLPFHQEVLEVAGTTALAPALIHAVITVESKHNPKAMSRKGAYGLMQLMPATAKRYGLTGLKKANHRQNILVGARYLKELIVLFDGDLELALAAYNAGPAAVKKYQYRVPPFRETKLYVPKVLKLYRKYSS